jgi:uncharacterized protein (UPF0254 family)
MPNFGEIFAGYWLNGVRAIITVFKPEKAVNTMEIRVFRQEDFEEVITLGSAAICCVRGTIRKWILSVR